MSQKLLYRPEIDGLRAIAVVSVILYHFNVKIYETTLLNAGSLGVDIFFVISGYLIGLIILKEIKSSGKFSFSSFYLRRARRILPALLLVIFVSLPFAWNFLLPTQLFEFCKTVLSAIFFYSNFYFNFLNIPYGATWTKELPFLHTWTLSVEEQFYIIFPIILLIVNKFFKRYFLSILTIFFLVSFLLAAIRHAEVDFSSSTFYLLHSRFWELVFGSILALMEIENKIPDKKNLNKIFPTLGLVLILISLFFLGNFPHPSSYTLPVVFGTGLIISFSKPNKLITKILSNKLLVGIGLISYSLYLWHYPILSFQKIINSDVVFFQSKFLSIALIFILSILSYFFIEKPFRNKKIFSSKIFIIILTLSIILLSSLNLLILKKKGFEERWQINNNFSIDNGKYLNEWLEFRKKHINLSFNDSNKKNILIIGDSVGSDTFNIFIQNKELFKKFEFAIFHFNNHKKANYELTCLPRLILEKDTGCRDDKNLDNNFIKLYQESEIIVISTYWDDEDILSLDSIIKLLKKDNKKIIVTSMAPNFPLKKIFSQNATIIDEFVLSKDKSLPNAKEKNKIENKYFLLKLNNDKINKKIKDIAEANNTTFLNKENYLCDKEKQTCDVLTSNNEKIIWDNVHLSIKGAKYLGKKIHRINWFKLD